MQDLWYHHITTVYILHITKKMYFKGTDNCINYSQYLAISIKENDILLTIIILINVFRLFIDVRCQYEIIILLFVGYGRRMSLSKTFRIKAFACWSYILEVNLQACMVAQSSSSSQGNILVSLPCQAIVLDLVRLQILKVGFYFCVFQV